MGTGCRAEQRGSQPPLHPVSRLLPSDNPSGFSTVLLPKQPFPEQGGLVVAGVREREMHGVKYHLRSWYSGTSLEYEKKIFISFFACESECSI